MRLLCILALRALCVVSLAPGVAAAQSLPAPTNPNLRYLGYYFADGRAGDFTSVVFPFTNLYIAIPTAYDTANPDWQTPFRNSLQNAFNNGKAIQLLMADGVSGQQTFTWDAVLDVARDFWSRIEIVEVLHEPPAGTSAAFIEAKINELKQKLNARSLDHRPISVQFGVSVPTDAITAPSLDIVGIEAYLDAPGHPDPAVNVAQLNALMDEGKNRVRNVGKKAILVMQAFDRNFTWTNIETLRALQEPVYLSAYNDPVVVAVTMFAYGRGGGTLAHPELETHHRRIAAAMGLTPPPGSPPVALEAAHGQWWVAEGGGGGVINANRDNIGPWEVFNLVDLGGGHVALRCSNGQYVVAEGGGGRELLCNRNAIGAWETFLKIDLGGGYVALQCANGQYVVAEGGGGREVLCNRDAIGAWETFYLNFQ